MTAQEIQTYAAMAEFLIGLGITTAQRIRQYLSDSGHDEETLAAILAEIDQRLARRPDPPVNAGTP